MVTKRKRTVARTAVDAYDTAARQILRALRGKRSQVAFARRLGYRGNPITDWENGRRYPTALEVFRAAELVKRPLRGAFESVHPTAAPEVVAGAFQLAEWLNAVRGPMPIVELATRLGHSRYTIGRWLAGTTQPRFHEFLHFVDAVTGRVPDWVAALVSIEQVPALLERYRQARAAKTLAFEQPWTEAILRVLDTDAYRRHPEASHSTLAAWLGIDPAELDAALVGLREAGVILRQDGRYVAVGALSVDTRSSPEGIAQLRQHWLTVAQERVLDADSDWFGYNVISVSNADLKRIRQRLQQVYRETRSLVAVSEPSETAALLVMQLSRFGFPGSARGE